MQKDDKEGGRRKEEKKKEGSGAGAGAGARKRGTVLIPKSVTKGGYVDRKHSKRNLQKLYEHKITKPNSDIVTGVDAYFSADTEYHYEKSVNHKNDKTNIRRLRIFEKYDNDEEALSAKINKLDREIVSIDWNVDTVFDQDKTRRLYSILRILIYIAFSSEIASTKDSYSKLTAVYEQGGMKRYLFKVIELTRDIVVRYISEKSEVNGSILQIKSTKFGCQDEDTVMITVDRDIALELVELVLDVVFIIESLVEKTCADSVFRGVDGEVRYFLIAISTFSGLLYEENERCGTMSNELKWFFYRINHKNVFMVQKMLERLVGRGEDRASLEHSALGEAPRESYRELKALAAKYPNISKKANEIGNEILEYISPFDGYFEKQEKSNFTKKKAGSDNLLNSFKEATSLVFRDPTARTKETQKMASWGKTPHFVAHGISGKGKDTNNDDEIPTWVEAKVNMIKRTTLKNKQDKQISQLWRNMMVNFAPLGIGKNTIYAFNALCGVEGASEYGRNIVVGDEELLMIKREVENSQVALQTTDLKINKQFFLFLVPLVHSLAVLIRRWCLDEMNEKLVLEKYNKPDACPFFSIGCLPFVFYEESKSLVTDFNVDNKTRYPSLLSPGASFISATSEKRRVLTLYAQLYAFAYIFNNVPSALSGCHVLQKELWVQLLFDHKLPYYFLNMLNFSGRCHVDSLLKPLVDQLDLDNSQLQDFSLPGDESAQYDKPKTFKHLQLSHVYCNTSKRNPKSNAFLYGNTALCGMYQFFIFLHDSTTRLHARNLKLVDFGLPALLESIATKINIYELRFAVFRVIRQFFPYLGKRWRNEHMNIINCMHVFFNAPRPSAYESSEHTEQSDRHKEAGTPNILKSSYVFGPQFHSDYLFYINKNSSIENEYRFLLSYYFHLCWTH